MVKYDYIAIGGGSAGIASANRAAEYGAKALIIEENEVGGTCVNVGCVPKKITWYASHFPEYIKQYGKDYGFDITINKFDFKQLKKVRDAYIERVHRSYFNGFKQRKTDYVQGKATFIDNHTVEVNGEYYQADHIAIVTGSHVALPNDVEGIELVETSDDFFRWDVLPQSVVIVGAGYIAVELAGMLNSLGVKTSLAYRYERPLRRFDTEIVDVLVEQMKKAGIEMLHHHHPVSIEALSDGSRRIHFKEAESVVADTVIYAIGRTPNTQNLGLEHTDIALTQTGHVKVDTYHRTTVNGVHAFGDVIGKADLTPVAIKAGRTLSDTLFGNKPPFKINYSMIPTVMFSHPSVGQIGYSEQAAKAKFGEEKIKVYQSRFTSMFTAVTMHREPVLMKLITLGEEEKVIGLHGIGFGVDEMIQGFAVAMQMGATKQQFDETIAIHPTGAEEFVTMR